MTNKNRVIVKILGQEYKIVGDESREFMQKVSNYVDDKMNEIAERNKRFSTAMIAVLTAINIGDEYFKLLDKYEEVKLEKEIPIKELNETKNLLESSNVEIEKKEKECDDLLREYNNLLSEYEKIKENFINIEANYSELKEVVNRLSYEMNIKDSKLEKAEKINEDLKNKLLQSEMELLKTKKELQEFIETFD